MATKVKIAVLILVAAFGVWLTFQSGVEGRRLFSSWNCAASRALICFQR